MNKEEFIKKLKESENLIKENIGYKHNNLDYKVGMEHGFEFAMQIIDKLAGEKFK